ncbi:MAG: hypothetical protein C4523_00345 [Myxococcales bacterium]|nr:MAG: hypothetical protein C4523_00345 [Myxococcales bacterium]
MKRWHWLWVLMATIALMATACAESDDGDTTDGDASEDGDVSEDGDEDGDGDATDGDDDEAAIDGDAEAEEEAGPPERLPDAPLKEHLPFDLTRPDEGAPLTDEEITAFTKKITGFWKQIDYFRWVLWTSHGVDASTGLPDWMVWWTGVKAIKSGDLVTFYHHPNGGPDNIMIPTSKVLAQAAAGYLLTDDPLMGQVTEQYSKGWSATFLGMVFDENDTVDTLPARAIIPNNHEFTFDGRRKAIDYTEWRHETTDWNTNTIHYPNNPYWGDIWLKNMRSKDDVCHLFRTAPWLRFVAEWGQDETVKEAAGDAYMFMRNFAKDVVDSGYTIRTKDADGNVYTPTEDLASFVAFDILVADAECYAKLTSALLGYGQPLGIDCGQLSDNAYEKVAVATHYYNMAIIRNFHMSAIAAALMMDENDVAKNALAGLIDRTDRYMSMADEDLPVSREEWDGDMAVYLVQSASLGMPLTSNEARLIQQYHAQAADVLGAWPYWDLWDAGVPDGEYDYRANDQVEIEEIAFLLEYCVSPYTNETGAKFVDCEVVLNPAQWGL